MINLNDKRVIINKSGYQFADRIRLDGTINRINRKLYDIKIYDKINKYLIIATPKIEEV